jgi:hypothetical protein
MSVHTEWSMLEVTANCNVLLKDCLLTGDATDGSSIYVAEDCFLSVGGGGTREGWTKSREIVTRGFPSPTPPFDLPLLAVPLWFVCFE